MKKLTNWSILRRSYWGEYKKQKSRWIENINKDAAGYNQKTGKQQPATRKPEIAEEGE